MSSSILVLIACLVQYYLKGNDNFNFESILYLFFSCLSFLLFFGRLFWGDTNYNILSGELGVNTIFHSKYYLLRNKRIIDAILLSIQGSLFVIMAWMIDNPFWFFVLFHLGTAFNIFWLLYQNICITLMMGCVSEKYEKKLGGYTKKKYLNKIRGLQNLQKVINIWLTNNIIFCLIACVIYLSIYWFGNSVILVGIILTLFTSILDFYFSGFFYSQPENYLENGS